MGRPVRFVQSERYYFITNRCVMRMFLMRPDDETNRILRACLARAADKYDVELVCFCFLSNHFHLIARFPELNMAEFMEELQSQIAQRVNKHRGRTGTFFPQRYDDQALLDEQALLDKICYVVNNPVKDGLVERAEDWAGVTSMECHTDANSLEGHWLNGETWYNLKRRKGDYERVEAMETYTVRLHLPEALDGETDEARHQSLVELIEEDRRRIWVKRDGTTDNPPPVFGAENVEDEHWEDRPKDRHEDDETPDFPPRHLPKRRRMAWASSPHKLNDYKEMRGDKNEAYRRAVSQWRNGEAADFPPGTYPPAWRHCVGSPARA